MDRRINDLIKNKHNVKVSKEDKEQRLENFISDLSSLVVKMNDALYKIGADCGITLLPENNPTNQFLITENKTGTVIYSLKIDKDAQILNVGFEKERFLKAYYISLNEGIIIESVDNGSPINLEDILMLDLKRIIEINSF
ncbi:hypothetical protein [Salinicoccus kekensis]|uniref:Uncharacterized protein n=1 Tax=Salinicoccus kekensis TaxID=714307 RepID=A0A285UPH8_9STAP|nr:hypothetical protein [Salinicoccus kekensis]SOC43607.1 hypothetical protein SAMN05878391_2040 [Salinicoccus kekensis]